MMRLTTIGKGSLEVTNSLNIHYGGAESNVISSLVRFNHKGKFITKLSNDSIGRAALRNLMGSGINTEDIIISEGRLGKYFVEEGYGFRNTNVIYDRKDSVFSKIDISEMNFEKVLEGVDLVHISGVTPALSDSLKDITLELMRISKEKGIMVSYDSNYRSKLWSYSECGEFLTKALKYVDIAFLGELDAINLLDIKSDENELKDRLIYSYIKINEKYPNIKYFASTNREVISSNRNSLKGYLYHCGKIFESSNYGFDIIDRIGGGDAFTSGILNCILKGFKNEYTVEFGVVASVYKHSYKGDINLCDERMVEDMIENGIGSIGR